MTKAYTVHKLLTEVQENPPQFVLTRDVTQGECDWLKRTYKKGEKVFKYTGATYGCCSYDGVACSDDGETPFYELPLNALANV